MVSMFLIVFTFMLAFIATMAVGVMFGRKPIAGSCGGMASIGMESECDVCGGDKSKCDKETKLTKNNSVDELTYDATNKNN